MLRYVILLLLSFVLSPIVVANSNDNDWQPVIDAIEASPIEDVTVVIGNADGEQFRYTKGDFNDQQLHPIASASKWLTAIYAMQLVEDGLLSLDANPQDYLADWPSDPSDPLSDITVRQMLAFTTGFGVAPGQTTCVDNGDISNEQCLTELVSNYFNYQPGTTFYYGPAHMHLLGVIIEQVTGKSYDAGFRETIVNPLGLSPRTGYYLPSLTNSRIAGGAIISVNDYYRVLAAVFNGEILADSQDELYARQTPDGTVFTSTPSATGPAWQYGLGTWLTCADDIWTEACAGNYLLTSPGAFGWTPYIDQFDGHFGLIAQVGRTFTRGTFNGSPSAQSVDLLLEIEPLIDDILSSSLAD